MKKKQKRFNQELYNVLAIVALFALTGYVAMLSWMIFDLQQSNMKTAELISERVDRLEK